MANPDTADPYVPSPRSRAVADRLGVPLEVVPGGGHFGAEAGFTAFPPLLGAVRAACGGALHAPPRARA